MSPHWFRDAKRPETPDMVFHSNRSPVEGEEPRQTYDLWEIFLDSTGGEAAATPEVLFDQPETQERYPAISPAGDRVAFQSDGKLLVDGEWACCGSKDIWVFSFTDDEPRPELLAPAPEDGDWPEWAEESRPMWVRGDDGRDRIYFTSNRPVPGASESTRVFNVWMKPVDGSSPAQPVTGYAGVAEGLPERSVFTRFAVSPRRLVVRRERRRSQIVFLELGADPDHDARSLQKWWSASPALVVDPVIVAGAME